MQGIDIKTHGMVSENNMFYDLRTEKFKMPTSPEVTTSFEVTQNYYMEYYKVQKGDVVVDIGSYLGNNIIDFVKMGAKCFALEPMKKNYNFILNRLKKEDMEDDVVLINKAISDVDGSSFAVEKSTDTLPTKDYKFAELTNAKTDFLVDSITLRSLVEENDIDRIDFLKMDCEGGEYCVFTNENYDYIKNNVRNIALEFHTHCALASDMVKARQICRKMRSLNFDIWVHRLNVWWDDEGIIKSEKLCPENTEDFINRAEDTREITNCMFFAKNNNFITGSHDVPEQYWLTETSDEIILNFSSMEEYKKYKVSVNIGL